MLSMLSSCSIRLVYSYVNSKTVEMTYNPLKQLPEMKDWLGTTKITLDDFDKTGKVTDFEGKEVKYGWNELDQKGGKTQCGQSLTLPLLV